MTESAFGMQAPKQEGMRYDHFGQSILAHMDKSTVDGYTEALLIAMTQCRDTNGLLIRIQFGSPFDDIFVCKQIAALMLEKAP